MRREVLQHRLLFLALMFFIGLGGALNADPAEAALTSADCAVCHAGIAYNPITPHQYLA